MVSIRRKANLEKKRRGECIISRVNTDVNTKRKPASSYRKKTYTKSKRSNCSIVGEVVAKVPSPLLSLVSQCYGAQVVPCLVMEKTLTATDINLQQGRLSFPMEKIANKDAHCWLDKDKLYQEELKHSYKDRKVRVLDPKGVWNDEVKLKIWKSGSGTKLYNLSWNKILRSNGFKVKDVVTVWSFRIEENNNENNGDENGHEICFVIALKEN